MISIYHDYIIQGESKLYPVNREGVVIRNNLKNMSFKVINPIFLLENDE